MKIQVKYSKLMKKFWNLIKKQKGKVLPLHLAKVSDRMVSNRKHTKILTPKQILHRLPIALAQVKAGNTSENFLTEIRQTIYSLCGAKEITKKVYNNIMNSIKL